MTNKINENSELEIISNQSENNLPNKKLMGLITKVSSKAKDNAPAVSEINVFYFSDLVKSFKLLDEKFPGQFKIIYYPCCGNDISPSEAFKDRKVIFADLRTEIINAINKKGLEGYNIDVTEFSPEGVDLVILLNPALSSSKFTNLLKIGGIIVANDNLGNATELVQNDSFELVGFVDITGNNISFIDENLDDCFKEVETDEELKSTLFSFGFVDYESLEDFIFFKYGIKDNLIINFKKYLKSLPKEENEPFILFRKEGEFQDSPISKKLPRKRGTTEDLYIFKKIK